MQEPGISEALNSIAGIFKPCGNPHKTAGDAQGVFLVLGQALMGCCGGVRHDGFRIRKVVGDREQLKRVQKLETRVFAALHIYR